MLNVSIDQKKEKMLIGCGGTLPEILSDLGTTIHVLHVRLCKENLFLGLEFEKAVKDPEFWELIFKTREEDAEIFKKGDSENG